MSSISPTRRPPNSSDVARLAGVSRAMVSYVFNGRRDGATVPGATRARIVAAAEEIGYRPNRTARALRTGRTNTIALWAGSFATPYYASILGHVQNWTSADNYEIVIACGKIADAFDTNRLQADGAIVIDQQIVAKEQVAVTIPVVSMGAFFERSVDHVGIDLYTGTRNAIAHLRSTGKKQIAYLAWQGTFTPGPMQTDSRLAAYDDLLPQLEHEPIYIPVDGIGRRGAYTAIESFWKSKPDSLPDAILCLDDILATGALAYLRGQGIRIPQDVAVIGCDGIEEGEFSTPTLTTLNQPVLDASKMAWQFLRNRLANPEIPLQSMIITPTLILRESA